MFLNTALTVKKFKIPVRINANQNATSLIPVWFVADLRMNCEEKMKASAKTGMRTKLKEYATYVAPSSLKYSREIVSGFPNTNTR